MAGFEAQPVVTGDVVWAAGTDGTLAALELRTGHEVWSTQLGTPLLAAPAVSGRWLVVAGFDGVVRGLATGRAASGHHHASGELRGSGGRRLLRREWITARASSRSDRFRVAKATAMTTSTAR